MNACLQCQAEFTGIREGQKYCSAECRKAGRQAYQRAYKPMWLALQAPTYRRDSMRTYRAKRGESRGGDNS